MPAKTNRYCVCVNEDGAPREITRSGAVVTYKAIDYQTGNPVALQTIPSANLDEAARRDFEEQTRAARKLEHINIARVFDLTEEDEHLVFASEFLSGETAENWLVTHGPMPADAVLRIGLQVVSALKDATFHNITHRALQPSNMMIVPGVSPDGGWPFVKLLNFGLAGLKLYEKSTAELVSTISPQFASPEQLENGSLDFRSEVFSLGATMCFLLTGAVPLLGKPNAHGVAERTLPRSAAISRPMRKLLRKMLRTEREERPPDPHSLSDEMRAVLEKIERRQGPAPLVPMPATQAPLPIFARPARESAGRRLLPALAAIALLLVLGAVAAAIYPDKLRALLHHNQPISSMGIPIGVPDNPAPPAAAPTARAVAGVAAQPATAHPAASVAAPEVVANEVASARSAEMPTVSPEPIASSAPVVVADNGVAEPKPPAEGPSPAAPPAIESQAAPVRNFSNQTSWAHLARQNQEATKNNAPPSAPAPADSAPPQSAPPPSVAEKTDFPREAKAASRKLSPAKAKNTRVVSGARRRRNMPSLRIGTEAAEFVGTNRDGNWVLRLPSGQTVVTPAAPNPLDAPVERHGRLRKVQIPPRALPADDSPSALILPPGQ